MPPESNGPTHKLPNVNELDAFLEGQAKDVEVQQEEVAEEGESLRPDPDPVPEDEELPAGDTFDRKYVEKLRRESASYRERAKKYESAFEGYEEGAVEEWKSLISGFRTDPKSVAEQMKELSEQILGQFTPEEQEEITEALTDEEQPLTMKQLQTILDQRQQENEMESLVRDIEREATELGYNLKSREYKVLLMTAQELPSGDIKEAHALLEGEKQRIVDAAIAELEKQAGGPRTPSNKVGVPSQEKDIKTMKDAKEALSAFLDGQFR